MLVCLWVSDHSLGNKGRMRGESRAPRLVSHPHSSSWRLSSLLWSVSTLSGPPAEIRDEKVAKEIHGNREIQVPIICQIWFYIKSCCTVQPKTTGHKVNIYKKVPRKANTWVSLSSVISYLNLNTKPKKLPFLQSLDSKVRPSCSCTLEMRCG